MTRLIAKTSEVGKFVPDYRPIYPFDASTIPSDTVAHLKATQRESPLISTIDISSLCENANGHAGTRNIRESIIVRQRLAWIVERCKLYSSRETLVWVGIIVFEAGQSVARWSLFFAIGVSE